MSNERHCTWRDQNNIPVIGTYKVGASLWALVFVSHSWAFELQIKTLRFRASFNVHGKIGSVLGIRILKCSPVHPTLFVTCSVLPYLIVFSFRSDSSKLPLMVCQRLCVAVTNSCEFSTLTAPSSKFLSSSTHVHGEAARHIVHTCYRVYYILPQCTFIFIYLLFVRDWVSSVSNVSSLLWLGFWVEGLCPCAWAAPIMFTELDSAT